MSLLNFRLYIFWRENSKSILSCFQNSFLTSLLYLIYFVFTFPMSFAADFMMNSGRFSRSFVRKFFSSVCHFGPALGLVWLATVGCDSTQGYNQRDIFDWRGALKHFC